MNSQGVPCGHEIIEYTVKILRIYPCRVSEDILGDNRVTVTTVTLEKTATLFLASSKRVSPG